jgi:hypothetical protein
MALVRLRQFSGVFRGDNDGLTALWRVENKKENAAPTSKKTPPARCSNTWRVFIALALSRDANLVVAPSTVI